MIRTTLNIAYATVIILAGIARADAAEISKAQATAEFRVKVAMCKSEAGKNNSSEFYRAMAACIDKAEVTAGWRVASTAPAK
jgi:hypothetical protein